MNITHRMDIPSETTEMTMTMCQDNTGRPYLYVAIKEGGLRIFNITNIDVSPPPVKTIPTSSFEGLDVMNLTQVGNYLYLALGNHFTNPEISGFAIVDVTDVGNAAVTDYWTFAGDTSGAGIVKLEGNYAYLGAMKNGLIILDISDKSDIKFVSQYVPDINYPTPNPNPDLYNARGMEVKDGIVYLCYDAGGIRIINTTDKQNPRETGRFSNPLLNGKPRAYNNLVLDDTLLYVAVDYCGVEVLSVSDTSNIKLIGWWNPINCVTGNWFASPVHANEIEYNNACKQLYVSTGKSDMYVLDVSDPTTPDSCTIYGGIDNQRGTWGVSTQDDRIYLSYVFALIPFQSNWTGVTILTYTPCTADVKEHGISKPALYPQPTSNNVTLKFGDLSDSQLPQIEVTNMLGELVNAPVITIGDESVTIDISNLPDGIYFLNAVNGSSRYSQKCIKRSESRE